jgi:hypothetical protein
VRRVSDTDGSIVKLRRIRDPLKVVAKFLQRISQTLDIARSIIQQVKTHLEVMGLKVLWCQNGSSRDFVTRFKV